MDVVFIAVGLAIAIATWLKPAESAGILLVCAPLVWAGGAADINATSSAGINLPVVVCGAATLTYARFLLRPVASGPLRLLRGAAIIYCLATLPAVLMAPSLVRAFGGYVRLISPVVFMFAMLHACRPQGVGSFTFKAVALAPFSLVIVVLAAYYSGEASYFLGGFGRLRAFHLSPQHIALFSVMGSGILICGLLVDKRRVRYAVPLLLLIVCAYLTGYRTAWIGIAVSVSLILTLAVTARVRNWVVPLLLVAAATQSGTIIQSITRYSEPRQSMSLRALDTISSGRVMIDAVALDRYFAGTPAEWLFGIGPYSSEQVMTRTLGVAYVIHSDYLATLIECGVLGFASYVFLLFTIGRLLLYYRRRVPRTDPAYIFLTVGWASFVAFVVMAVASALYANVFIGWFYYGFLGIALAQLKAYKLEAPLRTSIVTRNVYRPDHPGYVGYSVRNPTTSR